MSHILFPCNFLLLCLVTSYSCLSAQTQDYPNTLLIDGYDIINCAHCINEKAHGFKYIQQDLLKQLSH